MNIKCISFKWIFQNPKNYRPVTWTTKVIIDSKKLSRFVLCQKKFLPSFMQKCQAYWHEKSLC